MCSPIQHLASHSNGAKRCSLHFSFLQLCVCVQVTSKQGIDVKRSPSLPFMTSSMLTAAANQLGSDVARTMANAQVLFEGGEVGQSCFLLKTQGLRFSVVIAGAS